MSQVNVQVSAVGAGQMIVEAALELMVENGFAAMSMRSLAKKVGLHAGSLYHHFPSKLDVLEEVLDSLLQQRLDDWWARKPKRVDVLKLLDAFIAFHIQHVLEHSREEHLVHLETHHLHGPQLSRIQEQGEAYIHELSEIIRRGVKAGLFKAPDVDLVARSLLAMLSAAPSLCAVGVSRASITQMLTRMAKQLLWVH
ncbi:TetR/AcrR family transcriptional regulator [Pseudomonas sp. MWU13-2105]|uniref:TetR/AcrR family transcriptional regulator n=1 Tax=Pseudomonas sp. MWU13-2105 TaxID=2935074 RepID=UPI0020107592|nr:TetR/AcrR family transcriptional regulator [Pseudomonas sp. MWU13-2105]